MGILMDWVVSGLVVMVMCDFSDKMQGFKPRPRAQDLRHSWRTTAMRSRVHPAIADMIVGHGNGKTDIQSLYLSVSDADLLDAIDKMDFDHGETEIWAPDRTKANTVR